MRAIFPQSRFLRFTLFGGTGIALFFAAGYFALVTAFPPARMVSVLAEHVKTATGRDFRIDGRVSFRLLPTPAVVAEDVVLSNVDWGSRAEMLKVKRTEFEIALRPLLNGQLRILKVGLAGADLLLESDRTGRSNWIFASDEPSKIAAFELDQLALIGTNVTYHDGGSGATRRLLVESFKLQTQGDVDLLSASLAFEQLKMQIDGRVGGLQAILAGAAEWPFDLRLKLNGSELSLNGKLGLKPQQHLAGQISTVTVNLENWAKIGPTDKPEQPHKTAPVFGESEFSLDALPAFPVNLDFSIDQLSLPGEFRLSSVRGTLKSEPGRLVLEPLSFAVAGGRVSSNIEVGSTAKNLLGVVLGLDAKGLSVASLAAMSGAGGFHGGQADLKVNLKLKGNSPRRLAESATGEILLKIAETQLDGGAAALERNLISLLWQALMPGRPKQQGLMIDCGVVRLPLVNGVAVVDRSIAMESEQIAISASGTVDFAAQNLALAFRPQVKKGIGLSQSSLAHLVMLKGDLRDPKIVIDPKGTALEVVNIGVAVATGGGSLLASRLIGEWGNTSSCRTAIAGTKAKVSQPARKRVLGWPRPRD